MTYSINIEDAANAVLIQENNGEETLKSITLKTFFENAQSLGFFPEGENFDAVYCDVTFDFYGEEKTIVRSYASMLEADCFGTEDLEKIIMSFFDTFPERVYWVRYNTIQVLFRTPQRDCDGKDWRLYSTTTGTTNHLHSGFIDTEWSEFQTSKKTALEILLKQLEGQVLVVKNQLENL